MRHLKLFRQGIALAAGLMLPTIAHAQSGFVSVSGTLSASTSSFQAMNFVGIGSATFKTVGYSSGTIATGVSVAGGNFDPKLELFNTSNTLLASNDDINFGAGSLDASLGGLSYGGAYILKLSRVNTSRLNNFYLDVSNIGNSFTFTGLPGQNNSIDNISLANPSAAITFKPAASTTINNTLGLGSNATVALDAPVTLAPFYLFAYGTGSGANAISVTGGSTLVTQQLLTNASTTAITSLTANSGTIDIGSLNINSTNSIVFTANAGGTIRVRNSNTAPRVVFRVSPGGTIAFDGDLSLQASNSISLDGGTFATNDLSNPGGAPITWAAGTFAFGNASLGGGRAFNSVSLTQNKAINAQSLYLFSNGALSLDGGTLVVNQLNSGGGPFSWTSGTFIYKGSPAVSGVGFTNTNAPVDLTAGKTLAFLDGGTLNADAVVNLSGGALSIRGAGGLTNRGLITLASNASVIDVTGTGSFLNAGTIRGNGTVRGSIFNSGELRIAAGETMRFQSPGTLFQNNNDGSITLLDGTIDSRIDFINGGRINGRGNVLTSGNGLNNVGTVALSAGTSTFIGNVSNSGGGKMILSGGANVSFFNEVFNTDSSELRVSSGATATFFGNLNGLSKLTGSGVKIFEANASGGALAATGSTIVSPGATLAADSLREGSLTIDGGAVALTTAATSKVGVLAFAGSQGNWQGSLEVGGSPLIVDYAGTSPIANFADQVRRGAIKTIYSTLSGGNLFRLGYADAADIGVTTFAGESVDSTAILARFTIIGDANLDARVDTVDFARLIAGFGKPNAIWSGGDFDYNGVVNSLDFTNLATRFGLSGIPAPLPGATVPEPATLASLAAVGLLARRRR